MHYILYIPGLGDEYDPLRQKALGTWRQSGVIVQLIPMNWSSIESYEEKYHRATQIITELLDRGAAVSLVGESAGGSMAVNLFADFPEVRVLVTIAGVVSPALQPSYQTLKRAPAFGDSIRHLKRSLATLSDDRRRHIYTLSGRIDSVVALRYSIIPGASTRRIMAVGHLLTIASCLTFYKHLIMHYATSYGSVSIR